MKNLFLFLLLIMFLLPGLQAAPVRNQPVTLRQPDGSLISCLASGDEYFNYWHDESEFTIIQSPVDGYFYYAERSAQGIVPSSYRVDSVDPAAVGLEPQVKISREEYQARRDLREQNAREGSRAPHFGTLINLTVYIRFNDQSEFVNPRSYFDQKFNDTTPGIASVRNYYDEVSYQNLQVETCHYPECSMDVSLSYQDAHPRGYYSPYNAVTNPIGYTNYSEVIYREHTLLANAVAFIEDQVPDTLQLDGDNDNFLDSICFIIRGGNDGWADLLWAHRWALYSQVVFLHGKRVYDYTFQPETQNDVGTLCHEFFHLLGAPDLYHYSDSGSDPNGPFSGWDIMNGGYVHMSAYMKWRYGLWIPEIPLISASATYYLHPLLEAENNCFRINSPHSSTEYFVVEYRRQVPGTADANVPGSGLIISRVNTLLDGQGNSSGPPDELYLYRPGGTPATSGDVTSAFFSLAANRREFNDYTDPYDFLSTGHLGGIMISQVGDAGDSISFILNPQQSFLMGNITSTNPEADISAAVISLDGVDYSPYEGGDFFITHYQGEYPLTISLAGHGAYEEIISLLPGEITTLNVQLQFLCYPYNLDYLYSCEDEELTLFWDFDDVDNPDFDHFNIYMSINGNNFMAIGCSQETVYTRPLVPVIEFYYCVDAEYINGNSYQSNIVQVVFTESDDTVVPVNSACLYPNYPNPFNPQTTISYQIAEDGPVSLAIYNTLGQKVRQLVDAQQSAGRYYVAWDGRDEQGNSVSTGLYMYKMHSPGYKQIKKMILSK